MTIEPPPAGTTFSRDPVLVTTALFVFAQGVVAALLLASLVDEVVGGLIAAVIAAAWAAVSILFVRPATVPRQPLAQLAHLQEAEHRRVLAEGQDDTG